MVANAHPAAGQAAGAARRTTCSSGRPRSQGGCATNYAKANVFKARTEKAGVPSREHQLLLNALATGLTQKYRVNVTHLVTSGKRELFSAKYRSLRNPRPRNGMTPDLRGVDWRGVTHLGEADTEVSGSHTESQLRAFSSRRMRKTNIPVPFHVIVPFGRRKAMKNTIRRIGLGGKLDEQIHVWSPIEAIS